MRWLQWSKNDLQNGLGGVEVHARSIGRELRLLGIQVTFSSNPEDLDSPLWDVIHTHGSSWSKTRNSRAIRVHTLHGTTLGRMAACGEWTWPGGYLATWRELCGVLHADAVFTVNPNLSLFRFAKHIGKNTSICWNGWDATDPDDRDQGLTPETREQLKRLGPFWVFVGRGDDRMKGADLLRETFKLTPNIKWVAAPGLGFEEEATVMKIGRLNSNQVMELMNLAAGLVLPSRYEGHSLVLLESLTQGLPTVATRVGGVPVLPSGLQGLVVSKTNNPTDLAECIQIAGNLSIDQKAKEARAKINRNLLPNWKTVAETYFNTVNDLAIQRTRNA